MVAILSFLFHILSVSIYEEPNHMGKQRGTF
jgi:hypothetical protein